MDPALVRVLTDKLYEKRKATALELEKIVREYHQNGESTKINSIIDQLIDLFAPVTNALHVRNGGLIGLAATAIALGVDISFYMDKFMNPLLACFTDTENRVRYFACESLYNIAKVSKGAILIHFNPTFDALSKLVADSESSVKNGAELLDRLLRDIVAESASTYVQEPERKRLKTDEAYSMGVLIDQGSSSSVLDRDSSRKAFSLSRFIPLLADRMYVLSPFTRSWLVGWITVLDSVPDLELITYLPDLLDNLLKYLSDPTQDVKVATENLLADFLREIREVTLLQKRYDMEIIKAKKEAESNEDTQDNEGEKLPDITIPHSQRAMFVPENGNGPLEGRDYYNNDEADDKDAGAWIPGQGVSIDYAAIVEILISQFDKQHDEIQRSTALRWIAEFLDFAQETMIPFTPRLIPVILPNLAHHVEQIRNAAIRTDQLLFNAIQNQPAPPEPISTPTPTPTPSTTSARQSGPSPPLVHPPPRSSTTQVTEASTDSVSSLSAFGADKPSSRHRAATVPDSQGAGGIPASVNTIVTVSEVSPTPSRPQSPAGRSVHSPVQPSSTSVVNNAAPSSSSAFPEDIDLFDYQATVTNLTVQFLSEHEQTRVAALKWLIMLHQKAPKKILAMDDGTFPALLKTLSDSSEEVIKHDLRLLAQISSYSEEGYFRIFMVNLLELFSTDRRLLDLRGSLIVRQLCLSLNAERIYKTFAEIVEKEEDLEFASIIVQKLNLILITSPELADFRKRLKALETRQDGQVLFTILYRSWCHNPVAVFSLCLLAQAYEHASNLLTIFADLEVTVPFLVQIDKLVQLIESPVFTYLRLQLLEPEKYPYLFKCLYGLLMLLPQSSAFTSLRNRLNAVSTTGYLHVAPKASTTTAAASTMRSKIVREEIKWQELLQHFRAVQVRHEKARRQAFGGDYGSPGFSMIVPANSPFGGSSAGGVNSGSGSRPFMRRRVSEAPTGPGGIGVLNRNESPALSPLNPKARTNAAVSSIPTSAGNGLLSPNPPGVLGGHGVSIATNANNSLGPGPSPLGFGRSSPTLVRQKSRAISQNQAQTSQGQSAAKK